jgi:hypothetical protein
MSKSRKEMASLPYELKIQSFDKSESNNSKKRLAVLYQNYKDQSGHGKSKSICNKIII